MDLLLAGRKAGKTHICIDRLLSASSAVMIVHDEERKKQVMLRVLSRVSRQEAKSIESRVITLRAWRDGVHLGKTADPLIVDDLDDILMSLLGCYVAFGTVTQR